MILSGAQILVEELIKHKVKNVFGYPGGAVLNIYDALYKNSSKINHIITAHEQGATNLVTGIANAYLDSIPLVAITGNVPSELLGKDSFQEVDIVGITLPIIKHNYIVKEISDLEKIINEAFYIAKEGRPGPVLIDIPKDIQIAKCEYPLCEFQPVSQKFQIDNDMIKRAIKTINESSRPLGHMDITPLI